MDPMDPTPPTPMDPQPQPAPARSTRGPKLVGALVGALAALSIGGVGLAFAQEASDTPSTGTPAVTAPADGARPDDCPEKAGRGGGGGGGGADAPAPAPAPSDTAATPEV